MVLPKILRRPMRSRRRGRIRAAALRDAGAGGARGGLRRCRSHVPNNLIYQGASSRRTSRPHARAASETGNLFVGAHRRRADEPRGRGRPLRRRQVDAWSSTQSPHSRCRRHRPPCRREPGSSPPMSAASASRRSSIQEVDPRRGDAAQVAGQMGRGPLRKSADRAQARDHSHEVEVGFTNGVVTSPMPTFWSISVLIRRCRWVEPRGERRIAQHAGPYTLRHFRYRTRAVATTTRPTGYAASPRRSPAL